MKIAKFQRIGDNGWVTVCEQRPDGSEPLPENYVRISEYVDVQFPPLPSEGIVPKQLAVLDKAESELRHQFALKLHEIAEQRAKLKALTHQVQE